MGTTFLSELLDEYGRPRDRYAGSGQLANETETAPVEWAAAQYDDGQVLLACQVDASAFGILLSGPSRFEGKSSDGVTITCDKHIGEIPLLRHLPGGEAGGWAVYRVSMLNVAFPAAGSPGLTRYLLTNFEFDARDVHEGMTLDLPGVGGSVRLAPEQNDPFAADRLHALRSPRPTAWLEVPPQPGQAFKARRIASDLCSLLSIARGTRVAWIQEEMINAQGVRTHLMHANRITKPFTPFAPIDPLRIGNTREFVNATYRAFLDRRDRYRLDRGTIDSVLDAKTETDFLETRGAKLAIALETLKHNVLVASDPDVEYYTSRDTFARSVEEMAECLRAVLKRNGVKRETAEAITAPRRLLSLNRRSFSNLLRRTCREIGLNLRPPDLELFVRCRNSLVHRGDFYCATASQVERDEVPPKATRFEEYLFLISVVDAFLLRLVDYRGPYLVRTGGSEWQTKHL